MFRGMCLAWSLCLFAACSAADGLAGKQEIPPEIKVGMRIESSYAGAWYPGTLKSIQDRETFVVTSDGSKTDSTVAAWRLRTAEGVDFLDLLKDPQRMAQRERDKLAGKDYFVGIWNTSNNPVILTVKSERQADGSLLETKEINLAQVRGWVRILADGTYEHTMYDKKSTAGKWFEDPAAKDTIVLEKGHLLGGDLQVTRKALGTILLQDRALGGAGYTGTIVPAKAAP